jgi:hypothetical protein
MAALGLGVIGQTVHSPPRRPTGHPARVIRVPVVHALMGLDAACTRAMSSVESLTPVSAIGVLDVDGAGNPKPGGYPVG